jgi:hypothetical protein
MKTLIGNCVASFDDDGTSLIDLFTDATHFAQVEEDSQEIDIMTFSQNVNWQYPNNETNDYTFWYNEDEDIYMLYDGTADIHYFYS